MPIAYVYITEKMYDALPSTPLDRISFIVSYVDDVFPNLRIALKILETIASCRQAS